VCHLPESGPPGYPLGASYANRVRLTPYSDTRTTGKNVIFITLRTNTSRNPATDPHGPNIMPILLWISVTAVPRCSCTPATKDTARDPTPCHLRGTVHQMIHTVPYTTTIDRSSSGYPCAIDILVLQSPLASLGPSFHINSSKFIPTIVHHLTRDQTLYRT